MSGIRSVIGFAGIAGVLVPLAVIWLPELRHDRVAIPSIPPASVQATLARLDRDVCPVFGKHDLSLLADASEGDIDAAIGNIKRAQLALPGHQAISFHPSFSAADLAAGDGGTQLLSASLGIPNLMVLAWERTGDPTYLRRARDYIRGWWQYEQNAWLPRALQWNDHAVAARVFSLTHYLCAIRRLPDVGAEEAGDVLRMIAVSGERLSRPGFFTVRTNHGVMENLALMHIAASFPDLPVSARFGDIGVSRFREQFEVYVSPEGAVNEHSAGYQAFGIALLQMAARYFDALGVQRPPDFDARFAKAVALYGTLRRPDGTLPAWGDTRRGGNEQMVRRTIGPKIPRPQGDWWGPESGIAVWWSERGNVAEAAQTLVTWANFATGAHKHADEMAVYIWMDRSDLLIGSGYWPDDPATVALARGWNGANGPHFLTESAERRGVTRLVGAASSSWIEAADLERVGMSGQRLGRQIIYVRPDIWLIVDHAKSEVSDAYSTSWTFDAALTLERSGKDSIGVMKGSDEVAAVTLSGCRGGSIDIVRGSKTPFAGWTAADGRVLAAPAAIRRCPADQPSAFVLIAPPQTGENFARLDRLELAFRGADDWELYTPGNPERVASRRGSQLQIGKAICGVPCPANGVIDLASVNYEEPAANRVFETLKAKYSRYPESWIEYRFRMTRLIVAIWCGALVLVGLTRVFVRRLYPAAPFVVLAATLMFWMSIAVWLQWIYFA